MNHVCVWPEYDESYRWPINLLHKVNYTSKQMDFLHLDPFKGVNSIFVGPLARLKGLK